MSLRDIAARSAYLDQLREMFVDSPTPAVPEKGKDDLSQLDRYARS